MPKLGISESFDLFTRDRHTKVECEVSVKLDGRELPNASVVGAALELMTKQLQEHVTESYLVVPERV